MAESPLDEAQLLQSIFEQLQTNETHFELDAPSAALLHDILTDTLKWKPDHVIARDVLAVLNTEGKATVLTAELATAFAEEIAETTKTSEPKTSDRETEYREHDVDNQPIEKLLALMHKQLQDGNRLTLSVLNIGTLIGVFSQSASLPGQEWMNEFCTCLSYARSKTTVIDEIHIDLPVDIADKLRAELEEYKEEPE